MLFSICSLQTQKAQKETGGRFLQQPELSWAAFLSSSMVFVYYFLLVALFTPGFLCFAHYKPETVSTPGTSSLWQ